MADPAQCQRLGQVILSKSIATGEIRYRPCNAKYPVTNPGGKPEALRRVAQQLELEGWIGEIAQGCGSDVHLIFVEGAQPQPSDPDKSEVATMHYDVEALVCLLRDSAHPTPVPVDFDDTPVPVALRSAPSPYAELVAELG